MVACIPTQLDIEYLKSVLSYDPNTGFWIWIVRKAVRFPAGTRAGTLRNDGYRQIILDSKHYLEHVLAWFYMTGEWPLLGVDHENRIKNDNRWDNLRLATNSQNAANSDYGIGVTPPDEYHPKWRASVTKNYQKMYLGNFDSREDAAAAYKKAKRELFGEFGA